MRNKRKRNKVRILNAIFQGLSSRDKELLQQSMQETDKEKRNNKTCLPEKGGGG